MYCVRGGMHLTTDQTVPEAEPEGLSDAPKVLYIAGMTRSGTTLLDNLLNELRGFMGAGEVRTYWRAMREPRTCGCGALVSECEFWTQVSEWIERRYCALPVDRALHLQRDHVRSLPLHLARLARAKPGEPSPGAEYAELMELLYRGIAAISGADVVVDSSKGPHDAYVLSRFTGVDLYVVHLVRDPRGVAYSWSRRAWHPDKPGSEFERMNASEVAIRWVSRNALTEGLLARRLGPRYMRTRYEDLVTDPAGTIERIAAMCGARPEGPPITDGEISLGSNHSVSGNPSRLEKGSVPIRADVAWKQKMPGTAALAASLGSAPLLRRYGYPVFPKRSPR
jgi:Sulfotransferase family